MDDPADGPRDDHDPTGQDTPTSDRRGAEEPFRVEESLLASEATGHPRRELDERLHGEPPGSHESQSGRHGEREGGRGEHGDHHGRPGERGAGQHAHGDGHGGMHEGDEELFRRRFFVSTLLSIPVILYSETIQGWAGFTMPAFPGSEWIDPVFAVVVFAYGGVPFLRMAAPELRERSPGMMTLISMAISVAFVYSLASVIAPTTSAFFWELVTLIDVMLLGHWIEMRSVRRASGALDELAKLVPDDAERIRENGIETVPVSDLSEGDLVLVRPGASVPADGVVEEGGSAVDESMITGESRPVSKDTGDEVIGGTINRGGSLRVRISATGEDTALAGIVRLVEEARQSESRTQVLADRAAGWLFYVALAAAAVTAVAWSVATAFDAGVVERAVTVLVIACPHALGLAVPLVVAINTSLAARNGMLVRDRIAMERARELDVVVFDKTGTFTTGEHGVVDLATVESVGEDEALALAAAVEGDSEHVIARAIREAADERGVEVPSVSDFEALEGPRRSRLRCWLTAASRAGGLTTPTLGRESLRPEGRKSTRTFITGDGTGECMDRGARLTRQIAADESPSVAVAEAVAEYLDQDSTDLRPLFEVVDGDALDAVLQAPDAEVTFEYQGAEVRVVGTSTVEVR